MSSETTRKTKATTRTNLAGLSLSLLERELICDGILG